MAEPTDPVNAPKNADTMFDEAARLQGAGDLPAAEACCRQLLDAHPAHAWGRNLLGVIHCQTGRGEEGIKLIAQAAQREPGEATFMNNLGTGLTGLGRHAQAVTAFSRALEIDPAYAAAHNNIGAPLKALGRLADAATHYREAARLAPENGEIQANLANVLLDTGDVDGAERAALEAVRLAPDYAAGHNNLGTVLHRRGLYTQAEGAFRRAAELRPGYADALGNLAEVLKEMGRAADAMAAYEEAWRLAPDEPDKGSNLLLALCGLDDEAPAAIAARHFEWAKTGGAGTAQPTHRPDTGGRLRVGYVSGDFRRHSVAYFLEPILEHHDSQAVETFCYANQTSADAVTERLRGFADHWRAVAGMGDAEMAAQIRADRIDILVDLAGHTRGNRLGVFRLKPAPVQVSYLGYPATTGLEAMDFRVTDPWADPESLTEAFHSEMLLRLDGGFLCYRPPVDAPDVTAPPYEENGFVTFGSFNNLSKLSDTTVGLWSEILRAVPDARLKLKAKALGDESVQADVRRRFEAEGIASERLELIGWITASSPLAAYHGVDIGLDTFPYHGTTTTLEALWMGVPVVTLAGDWHASRVGVSLLARAKADDLMAANADDYVKIAASLATKPDVIAEYRKHLRGMLLRGGLLDGDAFTRALETAYRDAVKRLFP